MPAQYEAMRDKFAQDLPLKEAKTKAAKIYNSKHPGAPVTNKPDYAKGHAPKAANYAEGGPVLGRTRAFLKEPVPFRTDEQPTEYGGSKMSKRTGDKCLPTVKPQSSKR